MKIIVNGKTYPLRQYSKDQQIVGFLSANYYLVQDQTGNEFAVYLPNLF